MIIVQLLGGLGNQMFQYAIGRNLSEKHKCELLVDTGFLVNKFQGSEVTPRKYELDSFNVNCNIATAKDLEKFTVKKGFSSSVKGFFSPRAIIEEKQFHFDEQILKCVKNTYLRNGYWQTPKYFERINDIILSDFTLKENINDGYLYFEDKIRYSDSVSIHVRRGDFITNKTANKLHYIDPGNYYRDAIAYFASNLANPGFFIFSDDITWCRKNIRTDHPVHYIDNPEGSAAEELILMSVCKHNIIANSSFSWWAAWLNENENKRVIAPPEWFNDKSMDTRDLIPGSWIKMI